MSKSRKHASNMQQKSYNEREVCAFILMLNEHQVLFIYNVMSLLFGNDILSLHQLHDVICDQELPSSVIASIPKKPIASLRFTVIYSFS